MSVRLITLKELEASIDRQEIKKGVSDALIAHAKGWIVSPQPGQLYFKEPVGDCHIKYGHTKGSKHFVIKIATGFYDNPKRNLPVNSGMVSVFSAITGELEAIFLDEGWLTSWRTAAAGAIASAALARPDAQIIAIIGAGHQAELQAAWHADVYPNASFVIAARVFEKSKALADRLQEKGLTAKAVANIEDAVASADLVITATPASSPLFRAEAVKTGTHITAIGADSLGKQELDPRIFVRAACIVVDDAAQCLHHGDFGFAVRAGLVRTEQCIALGSFLESQASRVRKQNDITVADLTGVAAEDIAIASIFLATSSK
jgi:ornithine cyclodeaminase